MMATMMIIVVILLAITKDRKGLKLNSPRQACHIMPSLIPSPRPPPDDKLSLVVPFCSPAILSPKHQKMTINIPRPPLKPIVVFCTVSQNQMDGSDSSQLFLHRAKLILFLSITVAFDSLKRKDLVGQIIRQSSKLALGPSCKVNRARG